MRVKKKNQNFLFPTLTSFSPFSWFLYTLYRAADDLDSFVREVRTLHMQPGSESL